MENSYESKSNGHSVDPGLQIIRHPSHHSTNRSSSSHWFDIRVFYIRISNFTVDDSTPENLTLNHIPLSHETLLEVNGARCPVYSDGASCLLRRNRVDKKSEEATFVTTDSIRSTGSVKFEIFDKDDLVLSGILEISHTNGFIVEPKNNAKGWSMNCDSVMSAGTGFLKGKTVIGSEISSPTIEVYIAGCYSGTPIILTKSVQLNHRKKHNRKGMLDSIPEYERSESQKDGASELDMQVADCRSYDPAEGEEDYNSVYWRHTEYLEGEDGELNWFNAGVRVGVGIGLGICVGVGIGVGLLVRSYQATTRTFKRRLV